MPDRWLYQEYYDIHQDADGVSHISKRPAEADKHDAGKSRLDLLPFDALLEVGKVMERGATKYGARNWELGRAWGRDLAAGLRHLFAWAMGEDRDPESGLSHLAHAACCILFLLAYDLRKIGRDDRK